MNHPQKVEQVAEVLPQPQAYRAVKVGQASTEAVLCGKIHCQLGVQSLSLFGWESVLIITVVAGDDVLVAVIFVVRNCLPNVFVVAFRNG